MPEDPNGQAPSQAPLNPDLAGYPTTDQLVAGYRASSEEGKRQRERADKAEAMLNQILQNQAVANPRQSVPNRSTPADRLTEFGVPVDAMDEWFNQKFGAAMQPIANGLQARQRIIADHPDYIQFESDVAAFISGDPELHATYEKLFAAAPEAAMEYGLLKFADSRRRSLPADTGQMQGKADAGIPTTRAGQGRREPTQDAAVQEAFERFQRTGSSRDAASYAKARLRGIVTDEFLNQ